MSKHNFFMAVLVLAFAPINSFATQEEDVKVSVEKATNFARDIKIWIDKIGTPEVKRADDRVKFFIQESRAPMIWVRQDSRDGTYRIEITSYFHLVLTYLADTNVIAFGQPQYMNCKQEYDQYLHEVYRENTTLAMRGLPLKNIKAPEVFSASAGANCRKFGQLFPIRVELRAGRDKSVSDAFLFFYFHELGHIAKRHKLPDPSAFFAATDDKARERAFLSLMKHNRQQETEADEWAVDQLIAMGVSPQILFNLPMFGILLASTGIDCAMEQISTHPFAVTRINNIFSRLEIDAERKYKQKLPREMKTLIKDVKAFNQKVADQLNCKR